MPEQPPPTSTPRVVTLDDQEGVRRILVDTLFGLWATVNNLTRLRPARRDRYRVTIFGSVRTEPGHWVSAEVKHIGIRVELPFEQEVDPFVEQAFEHQTFFTRLHHFVLLSDAYIVAPGGIGTVLESMMIWQLLQVRHLQDTPLVFAGAMWRGLVEWAGHTMLRPGFELASAADVMIPQCVDTADEAIAVIRSHHARWLAARGGPS